MKRRITISLDKETLHNLEQLRLNTGSFPPNRSVFVEHMLRDAFRRNTSNTLLNTTAAQRNSMSTVAMTQRSLATRTKPVDKGCEKA